MATKTLSIDEEAYFRLVRARRNAKESFSKVIKRARWDDGPPRCSDILARATGSVPDEVLDRLDEAQRADMPPDDPWKR